MLAGSLYFILALTPVLLQVSAFDGCNPVIIANIENSNLTPFPPPKIALFENKQFSYDYVPAYDECKIQSADIIFANSRDDIVLPSVFNRYLGCPRCRVSTAITFTDRGDVYAVDFEGFIDSPFSKNRVYIFQVEGVVVGYYCSLECPTRGEPLFTINSPIDSCVITEQQLGAVQNTINALNNNVAVPLVELRTPPTSTC